MDIILGLLTNVLEEGFIYGIMAVGVYITYSVLDFPDLSVDGTFPLGMCLTAMLITAGVNPWLACIAAFVVGAAAGCITGFLHVKLGITDLLSGILVMTGLYSVNLALTGGSAVLPFYNMPTIFNTGLAAALPSGYGVVIMVAVICIVVKLIIDLYLKTQSGMLLRASGDNPQYVIDPVRDTRTAVLLLCPHKPIRLTASHRFSTVRGSLSRYHVCLLTLNHRFVFLTMSRIISLPASFVKL